MEDTTVQPQAPVVVESVQKPEVTSNNETKKNRKTKKSSSKLTQTEQVESENTVEYLTSRLEKAEQRLAEVLLENDSLRTRVKDLTAEMTELSGVHNDSSEEQPEKQEKSEHDESDESNGKEDNSDNRKTKMCRYYRRGHCNKGENCDYAHGVDELKGRPPRPEQYERPERPERRAREDGSPRQNRPPRFRRGFKPQHQPPNYKTVICYNWEEDGKCPRGRNCSFAHGEEELRELE